MLQSVHLDPSRNSMMAGALDTNACFFSALYDGGRMNDSDRDDLNIFKICSRL